MITSLFPSLLSRLYPHTCVSCRAAVDPSCSLPLCHHCRERLLAEVGEGCPSCGRPFSACDCRPPALRAETLLCALPYRPTGGVVRAMILAGKTRRNHLFLTEYAERLIHLCHAHGVSLENAILTYVPRSPKRYHRTGLNQAEALALAVGRQCGAPILPLLACRLTAKQQKQMSSRERRYHAAKNFRLTPNAYEIAGGKTVVLVDDVVTTGATAACCLSLLRQAGAAKVVCLAAARTVKEREGPL